MRTAVTKCFKPGGLKADMTTQDPVVLQDQGVGIIVPDKPPSSFLFVSFLSNVLVFDFKANVGILWLIETSSPSPAYVYTACHLRVHDFP